MNLMPFIIKKIRFLSAVIVLSAAGCASFELPPLEPETPEDIIKAKEIWQKAEERDSNIESSAGWINDSYSQMTIKSLTDVPIQKYQDYKKFLDAGRTVYIVNHPGFFTFFQYSKINRSENETAENIIDIFINRGGASAGKNNEAPYNPKIINVMREFERIERNFIEFKSTEQKLVILVLPGNYKKYSNYRYKNNHDEYLRYLNDISNNSESVLYLESKKPNNGRLTDQDIITFLEFLHKIGAKSIMLGGEYVGRCQEDFYKQLADMAGALITVEIVPELSPPSPDDINSGAKDLLTQDNRLDVQAAAYNIFKNKYEKLDATPKIRRLGSRLFYEKPD